MASRNLVDLARIISDSVAKLSIYLRDEGKPQPSFDINAPSNFPALSPELMNIRSTALAASHDLHTLLLGPTEHLLNSSGEHFYILALQFIHRHRIAEIVLLGEEVAFEDIASARGLNLSDTKRFIRLAMTYHVFTEPREGFVAHTASSRVLLENQLASSWLGYTVDNIWPALPRVLEASEKWPNSEEPTQSAYCLSKNTDLLPFEFVEQDPTSAKQFKNAMKYFQSIPGLESKHFIEAFDFSTLPNGLFVDIGGSHGAVSIEVAQRHPGVRCIVQDLPLAVAAGSRDLPSELKERVSFMAHDYFVDQPVMNADVYYFRWIFHDWSDAYCVRILQKLIPALKPAARVVINEVCIPEYGQVPLYMERQIRAMDMTMKTFSNAMERDVGQWKSLFQRADERFNVDIVTRPPRSKMHIIVASWNP